MNDATDAAGERLAEVRRHAFRCEQVAAGALALTVLVVLGAVAGFIQSPEANGRLVWAGLAAAITGATCWAIVRAAGLVLHLKVDARVSQGDE